MRLMLDATMFDGMSVEIECPKCGDKTECEVGRLKHNQDFVCRTCDTTFHINAAGLSSDVDTAGEAVNHFLKRNTTQA
jgi:transcription elongation factor Elf1